MLSCCPTIASWLSLLFFSSYFSLIPSPRGRGRLSFCSCGFCIVCTRQIIFRARGGNVPSPLSLLRVSRRGKRRRRKREEKGDTTATMAKQQQHCCCIRKAINRKRGEDSGEGEREREREEIELQTHNKSKRWARLAGCCVDSVGVSLNGGIVCV